MGLFKTTSRQKVGGTTYTKTKTSGGKRSLTKSTKSGQYRESVNLSTGKKTKTKLW